jgi:hypothetical protein
MAASLTQQIDQSRKKLEELRDDTAQRAREMQRDIERRRQMVVARLRDGGREAFLSASATALSLGGKLPLGKPLGDTLEARARELEAARQELHHPPIEDYDELNVKQVAEALEGLDAWELEKVRSYEKEHKDRKTVYASIERKLR